MTDSTQGPDTGVDRPRKGLAARAAGVIFSPRETYAEVAARPRAFGILALAILLMAGLQGWLLSTDTGQQALFDRQLQTLEAFGATVTDEMYQQLESRLAMAPYMTAGSQVVFIPLINAVIAGLLMGVFNTLLGGTATFKHIYAVVSHSTMVLALQQVFNAPLSYVRGELASATTAAAFLPMLEPEGLPARLLGSIDFFLLWWVVNLAIGLSVLNKRPTQPIVWTLVGVYAVLAVAILAIRAAF